jgi:hypothetical protein
MNYEIVYVELDYKDDNVLILNWGVEKIGFGQVVLHPTTLKVIDDECMGEDFVKMIYNHYKESD